MSCELIAFASIPIYDNRCLFPASCMCIFIHKGKIWAQQSLPLLRRERVKWREGVSNRNKEWQILLFYGLIISVLWRSREAPPHKAARWSPLHSCGRHTCPNRDGTFPTAERKGLKPKAVIWGPSRPAVWYDGCGHAPTSPRGRKGKVLWSIDKALSPWNSSVKRSF